MNHLLSRAFARLCSASVCLLALAGIAPAISAQSTPVAVPTFHNIGLYWQPAGGSATNTCTVQYRLAGSTGPYNTAQPLWFDDVSHTLSGTPGTLPENSLPSPVANFQYRGSIVNLTPGTTYEIKLTTASGVTSTFNVATRSETIPEGTVTTLSGSSSSSTLAITAGGTPTAYRVYQAASLGSHTIDVNGAADHCITVDASYVIIRGLKLANARSHAIRLGDVTNVIIEDCEIYGWGRASTLSPKPANAGMNLESAIYSESATLKGIVIQRNRIRDPRHRSNSWAEQHGSDWHPKGPQAITFRGSSGGHIIRYNDFSMSAAEAASLTGKRYNDVMGETKNFSFRGFPGPDSDIYGNVISGAWDDGIEAEGGNANVRIFGNYITRTFVALGLATNSLGPIYVFRNIADQSQAGNGNSSTGKDLISTGGSFIKLGTGETSSNNPTNRVPFQKGRMFIFHNTVLHNVANLGDATPPISMDGGYYGIRGPDDTDFQYNITGRNNILRSRVDKMSIEAYTNPTVPSGNSFDYNITNPGDPNSGSFTTYVFFRTGTTATITEPNGQTGTPTYEPASSGRPPYELTSTSPGINQGVAIANFNDGANGAPDIGAHERDRPAYVYGPASNWSNYLPNADTTPPSKPGLPVASAITSTGFTLNWTASTDNVGVVGYDVFSGTTNFGTTPTNSFVVTNATPGTTYQVQVEAMDAAGYSTVSDAAMVVTLGNAAPAASLTAPANGATFTAPATVSLTATASDSDGTIAKVEFYQGTTKLGEDATSPYTFTWNSVPAGSYTLRARAIDNLGASTDSASRTITVNAPSNAAPLVSLTAPANGATFTAPATVNFTATASDSDGTIAKVEFYQGTTKLGEDTTSPYTFAWSAVPAGSYSLKARAIDNLGAFTDSATSSITVSSGGGAGTITLQQGIAPSTSYTGMSDTYITTGSSNANVNTNYGSVDPLVADGADPARILLRWNLGGVGLPASVSSVTNVTLTFYVDNSSANTFNIYALKRAWVEGEATWNKADNLVNWQTPGTDGSAGSLDREATLLGSFVPSSSGTRTVTLNADGRAKVQAWINGTAPNHGFIIIPASGSDGLDLTSKEETSSPSITARLPVEAGLSACRGCAHAQGLAWKCDCTRTRRRYSPATPWPDFTPSIMRSSPLTSVSFSTSGCAAAVPRAKARRDSSSPVASSGASRNSS